MMLDCKFDIDVNEELSFSKAVYYNLNPVPVKKPWRDATGGFGSYVPLQGWIRIYDDDGNCGEAFCSRGMIDNILPLVLTGEKKTYQEWYHYLYWKLRNFGFQSGQICDLGTFDLVMLDLMARRRHQPLHRFLGAKKDWAASYKGGGSLLSDDDDIVSDMTRYVEEGYTTVKFKVGSDWGRDMDRDIRRMRKVREAVGDDIEIAVDANQVFSVEDAIKFAHLVEPYHPAWFEEPIHSHDMNGIKEVCEACDEMGMMVGFGESMRNSFAFETYAEKGVGHLMPLVGRMTSMSDLIRIRDLARSKGLRFSSGGTVWFNAAFGALYDENERLENHEPMMLPMEECLSVHPTEKDGKLWLPDIEGLPSRLDVDKLASNGTLQSVRYITKEDMRGFTVRASY
ncbi:enolase C-terminal domain-like protein [Bifidobacterium bohemicum]|nr:enolase C-terminal domain-like protein [Bifidobacterium bohemicum]